MDCLRAARLYTWAFALSLVLVNADPLSRWQRLSLRIAELERKFLDDFTILREELYNDFVTRQELFTKYNVSFVEKDCPNFEELKSMLGNDTTGNRDSVEQIERALKRLETDTVASIEMLKRGMLQEKVFRRDVQSQIQDLELKYDLEKGIYMDILKNISLEISSVHSLFSRSVDIIASTHSTQKVPQSVEVKRDCVDWLNSGHATSGVYVIHPVGIPHRISVYCDMVTDGGGWVVFQRRCDGSENFTRSWMDYRFGFGNVSGEFWLGNELVHLLTSQWYSELRIDLEDFENETRYETYELFSIGSHEDKFRLHINGSDGTAGDCLSYHNDAEFTTLDDGPAKRCALKYKGGFWYKSCHKVNINGLYLHGQHESFADGVDWKCWRGYHYSLKRTEMKLRSKSR